MVNGKDHKDIYNEAYVEALFDKMSGTYERMNLITSFGFSKGWRGRFVDRVELEEGETVADLMTGMGECWKPVIKRIGRKGKLIALDFSDGMLTFAKGRKKKYVYENIEILKENVFKNSIESDSVDAVISGFGIKTFNNEQIESLAAEIYRMLKESGRFSLVEVSVPKVALLRWFYMFYLKRCIPVLGRLFLGNPDTYRMLGVYTEKFSNAKEVKTIFENTGFTVNYEKYFFGCATGVSGIKQVT